MMSQSGPVTDYVDALARELTFDPALSRRVRAEVEDHLWEAAGDEPGGLSPESQRRAVVNFGRPREIARQYVAAALLAQMRRVGALVILAVLAVFVAMKIRVAWYGHMQWGSNQDWPSVSTFGLAVDRYAFALAVALALIGCGYVATRRIPTRFNRGCGKELSRCMTMYVIAVAALLLVVITETILASIRLSTIEWRMAAMVPALSLGAEIAAACFLVLLIRGTIRRRAAASLLLRG